MTDLEACHMAADLLRRAGFEFRYASMKSEACYYGWPGETDLLRIAAHKHDRGVAGLGKIVAKATFPAQKSGRAAFSETHVANVIATSIGFYFLRNRGVVAYIAPRPRAECGGVTTLPPHAREIVEYLRLLGAEQVRVEHGGKHLRLVFEWRGRERRAPLSSTPGDSIYGIDKKKQDIRHMLGLVGGEKRVGARRAHRRRTTPQPIVLSIRNVVAYAPDWREGLALHPALVPVIQARLGAAWLGLWRDLAARNGHRSLI